MTLDMLTVCQDDIRSKLSEMYKASKDQVTSTTLLAASDFERASQRS